MASRLTGRIREGTAKYKESGKAAQVKERVSGLVGSNRKDAERADKSIACAPYATLEERAG
jgi:hypothetical protein